MVVLAVPAASGTGIRPEVVEEAFDWSLALLLGPIVLLAVVGAVLSLVRRKKAEPPGTPYRSNARSSQK